VEGFSLKIDPIAALEAHTLALDGLGILQFERDTPDFG